MAKQGPIESIAVAVAVITRQGKILTIYNQKWSAYSLPMTKRRIWNDPQTGDAARIEAWEDAAIRARAECVQGTTKDNPQALLEVEGDYEQSDRDGVWKRYHFNVFTLALAADDLSAVREDTEWLTPEEIMDEQRRPISKTTRDIISQAVANAQLQGTSFP